MKELLDRSDCALNFEEECSRFLHEKVLLYLFPSSPISLKKPPTNQPNTFLMPDALQWNLQLQVHENEKEKKKSLIHFKHSGTI